MGKILNTTLNQIPKLSGQISDKLKGGEIFGLDGPLGSGKTAFVKALGKCLNIKQRMPSPTFTLMHVFSARLKNKKPLVLYHLDLYRLKNFKEARTLGLTEFWGKPNTVTLIEWAQKIKKYLPKKTRLIKFKHSI